MILKKKIARVRFLIHRKNHVRVSPSIDLQSSNSSPPDRAYSKSSNMANHTLSLRLKNVSKNYGRAICNFILSDISYPYLEDTMRRYGINDSEFIDYIRSRRGNLRGITEFRSMLLIQRKDSLQAQNFKLAFQQLSEVFVKYFAVNWIFSSKLDYKIDYVRCRPSLLRRIQNPELFTYLH